MRKFILSALVALSFNINSFAQTGDWFWINPKPTGNPLTDVDFVGENTGFAVGHNGTIIKTIDGGTNWTNLKSPTGTAFTSCSFINSNTGYIAGEGGKVYKTTNSGNNWTDASLPITTLSSLQNIYFANESFGVSVSRYPFKVFYTSNGGGAWNDITSNFDEDIETVYANGTGDIYAGGRKLLKSSDLGVTWDTLYSPVNSGDLLVDFYVRDENNIIAHVSNYYLKNKVIKTINGGSSWTETNLNLYFSSKIDFDELGNGVIGGIYGRIFITSDWGSTWTEKVYSDTTKTFTSVSSSGNNAFYIVGSAGTILQSSNSGLDWSLQTKRFTDKSLSALFFFNSSTGIVVGDKGRIFRTYDGGDTWERIYFQDSNRNIKDITFTSPATGYLSNGNIYKTTDGGDNWFVVYDSLNNITKLAFRDNSLGLGYSGTQICRTTDGGSTWQVQTQKAENIVFSPSGVAVAFSSESVPHMGGVPTVIKSENGGESWGRFSMGSLGEPGGGSICFSPDNVGYLSYGYNRRLKSNDGFSSSAGFGQSFPYGTLLKSLAFRNSLNGICLTNGIHRTTDGGITWNLTSTIAAELSEAQYLDDNKIMMIGVNGSIISTNNGGSIITNLTNSNSNIPDQFSLHQNYPNPFNPSTKIKFDLPESSFASLKVYDITGRLVTTLVNSRLNSGSYSYDFNGTGLSSGMYFYKLETEGLSETKKMMLIK